MSKLEYDRRLFLKQLGLGAGSYLLNPLLDSLFLQAQGQIALKKQKLILLYMNTQPKWKDPTVPFIPKGIHFDSAVGQSFGNLSPQPLVAMTPADWPSSLDAMKPFLNNALVVDGIFHGVHAPPGVTKHGLKYGGLNGICGYARNDDKRAGAIGIPEAATIDHIIANGPCGQGVVHKSLLMCTLHGNYNKRKLNAEEGTSCFAAGAGSPAPFMSRIVAMERKLFGQDFVDGVIQSESEIDRKNRRRKRIIDTIKDDALRLERNLSSPYKDKINIFLESLETYDRKKDQMATAASCTPSKSTKLIRNTPEQEYLALVDGATLALKCGLTNVIGIGVGVEPGHNSESVFKKSVQRQIKDRWSDDSVSPFSSDRFFPDGYNFHNDGPAWDEGNRRIMDFNCNLLLRILENLSGQANLFPDDTTVLLVSDRGMSTEGNHHGCNGGGGRMLTYIWTSNPALKAGGQYIRFPTNLRLKDPSAFTALSDFYRTFAIAFGVNLPSFGKYGGRILDEILT